MTNSNTDLFPPTNPYITQHLDVGDGQILYMESYGNPEGLPAIFLHGGPGSGCNSDQARLFDPTKYHIILFDQRGSGRSTPKGALFNNTTDHLISDMELIRQNFSIDKWALIGGSWGSTLALAYAEKFPERVYGLVLRAIFLGTSAETQWAFETAPKTFYPDLWTNFTNLLPPNRREKPIPAFGELLENPDPQIHQAAAQAWGQFERVLSSLVPVEVKWPSTLLTKGLREPTTIPNTPFIEWHYIKNNWFFHPDQLMRSSAHLNDIPGILIQGRYDMLCPPVTAYKLAKQWRGAELRIIPASGHSAAEPKIQTELVKAIANLEERITLRR